jgi:hypothetical protein
VHAEQPDLAELQRELAGGQVAVLVPLHDVRVDDVGAHLAGGRPDRLLLVAQLAVEVDEVERVGVALRHRR